MKKQFKLDEIDCANCARELQDELAKLEGVKSVSVNFMTQKLTLEADDAEFDKVLDRVVEFTADAEPDCEIILCICGLGAGRAGTVVGCYSQMWLMPWLSMV